MERIKWCLKKKEGIILIAPNKDISKSYLKESRSDFLELEKQNSKWKTVIAYYACYNALYSVMTRHGIQSHIHSCTIELMELFYGLKKYKGFMNNLKNMRENTQYYLKQEQILSTNHIREFIDACEMEIIDCDDVKINSIMKIMKSISQH